MKKIGTLNLRLKIIKSSFKSNFCEIKKIAYNKTNIVKLDIKTTTLSVISKSIKMSLIVIRIYFVFSNLLANYYFPLCG